MTSKASMWEQRIAEEKAAQDAKPARGKKRRSGKISGMASMFEKKPDDSEKSPSPEKPKKRASTGKVKKWEPPTSESEDPKAEDDKPKPGKVGKLAAGLAINPAALKPGGGAPPTSRGKVGALAAGLAIPMGGMRPGGGIPPSLAKKRMERAAQQADLNSKSAFDRPKLPESRKARKAPSGATKHVSTVNEDDLRAYLSKYFEAEKTQILPQVELLLHLKSMGLDLQRSGSEDTYDLNSWHLSELDFVVESVFGAARHQWGYHLRAKVEEE
jgi:hypothetical protein